MILSGIVLVLLMANIAKLEEQINQLKAKLSKEKRKSETRHRVLIGVAVLKAIEEGVLHEEWIEKLLNRFIQRPSDRTFLELPELTQSDLPQSEDNGNGNQPHQHTDSQDHQHHQHYS